jgi:hypothetical protein
MFITRQQDNNGDEHTVVTTGDPNTADQGRHGPLHAYQGRANGRQVTVVTSR